MDVFCAAHEKPQHNGDRLHFFSPLFFAKTISKPSETWLLFNWLWFASVPSREWKQQRGQKKHRLEQTSMLYGRTDKVFLFFFFFFLRCFHCWSSVLEFIFCAPEQTRISLLLQQTIFTEWNCSKQSDGRLFSTLNAIQFVLSYSDPIARYFDHSMTQNIGDFSSFHFDGRLN